jgi:hypothetical protein
MFSQSACNSSAATAGYCSIERAWADARHVVGKIDERQ